MGKEDRSRCDRVRRGYRAKELAKTEPDGRWLDDIFPEHFVVDWSNATIR